MPSREEKKSGLGILWSGGRSGRRREDRRADKRHRRPKRPPLHVPLRWGQSLSRAAAHEFGGRSWNTASVRFNVAVAEPGTLLFAQQLLPVRDHAQRRAAGVDQVQRDDASAGSNCEVGDAHVDRLDRPRRFRRKRRLGADGGADDTVA